MFIYKCISTFSLLTPIYCAWPNLFPSERVLSFSPTAKALPATVCIQAAEKLSTPISRISGQSFQCVLAIYHAKVFSHIFLIQPKTLSGLNLILGHGWHGWSAPTSNRGESGDWLVVWRLGASCWWGRRGWGTIHHYPTHVPSMLCMSMLSLIVWRLYIICSRKCIWELHIYIYIYMYNIHIYIYI